MKKNPKYSLDDTIDLIQKELLKDDSSKKIKLLDSVYFHLSEIQKSYANGGHCHCVITLSKDEFEGFVKFQNELQ